MWQFNWLTPQQVQFGPGRFEEIGAVAGRFGRRILLVTGDQSMAATGRLDRVFEQLRAEHLEWLHLRVAGEPTVESIDTLAAQAGEFKPHAVVAVGGGSVLDSAKAVAALLTNGGETLDYLEGVGRGLALEAPALPLVAVPTTAGTGAEATKNAVIGNRDRTFKKSMRADGMLPAVALVDPELTQGSPLAVTAGCGLDALTQLLEAFTSRRANPLSDALSREGLAQTSALSALIAGENPIARERMALASLLGGICLANVGLGAVHGLASPLGAFYAMPHGMICGILLPAVVRINARRAHAVGNEELLIKYALAYELIARPELEGHPGESAHFAAESTPEFTYNNPIEAAMLLVDHLVGLNRRLEAGRLEQYGLRREDFPRIVAEGRGNSMKTNPVELSDDELIMILEEAF